jgi:hypothetical protein
VVIPYQMPQMLMVDASSCYTNLVASGDWKLEVTKHAQIIALTTQILEIKQEMSQVKISSKPSGDTVKPLDEIKHRCDVFQKWHQTKVENGNEFNMVKKDGTNYWWCNNHKDPNSDQSGIYVFHKPTKHDALKQRKNEYSKKRGKGKTDAGVKAPAGPSSTPSTVASTASASKISLAKSLQKALTD